MQTITKAHDNSRDDVSVSTLPGIMKFYPIKFRHYKN
jgi:hypothetical protein